jgi:hypothetical protein
MLRAGLPGFDSQQEQELSLFPIKSRPTLGPTRPPIQCVQEAFTTGVKWPGRESNHSSQFSAKFKKGVAVPPLSYMSSWNST